MQTSKVGDTSVYTIPCHLSKYFLPDPRFPTANENSIELSSKIDERNRDMAASCQVLFSIARLRLRIYLPFFLCHFNLVFMR